MASSLLSQRSSPSTRSTGGLERRLSQSYSRVRRASIGAATAVTSAVIGKHTKKDLTKVLLSLPKDRENEVARIKDPRSRPEDQQR